MCDLSAVLRLVLCLLGPDNINKTLTWPTALSLATLANEWHVQSVLDSVSSAIVSGEVVG